jgi:hypothetical protein
MGNNVPNIKTPEFQKIALTMATGAAKKPEIGTHIVHLAVYHPGFPLPGLPPVPGPADILFRY